MAAFRARWAKVGFGLLTSREPAALQLTHPRAEIAPISLSWGSLEPMVQASVLGFSPMDAPNEVLAVHRIHEVITEKQAQQRDETPYSLAAFEDHALALYEAVTGTGGQETFAADAGRIPAHAALRVLARAHELGLLGIWDLTEAQQGVMARLRRLGDEEATPRVVGVDLASLESPEGRLVAAEGALAALWQMARRKWLEAIRKPPDDDVRYPVFIVVDEAHNLAPAQPTTALTRYVTDHLVRIATEGRKYGLYLVMATQRPGRLHPTLLSQCANLCLMKMNNRFDLDLVEQGFGFLPEGAARRALQFEIGDALLAGKFVAAATYAHIAPRRTMEGGRNLVDRFWLQEPR